MSATELIGSSGKHYEIVVGLEVHCELATETKLFCGCANHFGSLPNTNTCPVCLGLPGSLPVLNERAVEYAMRIGLALNCTVNPSIFHRKNYFYPDQTKDYQISQYDEPINSNGFLELPDGSRVGIERAHMEEDTGKSTHIGGGGRIQGADYSLVDYNRAGVPLVEIVSRPDITSSDQAKAYVAELRGVLVASGASDGRMEEGSLRVDANVSVREVGSAALGTRCEVKNLNSLRSLGRAIDFEASRQVGLVDAGAHVVQETRHWNENEGRTSSMRSKEEANDYRYFPEPDLVPLAPSAALVESVRSELGVMPATRRHQLAELSGDAAASAEQIATVVELGLDALVLAAHEDGAEFRLALTRAANEAAAKPEAAAALDAGSFASLVKLESAGTLTATQAKAVLAEMLEHGGEPAAIADSLGFQALESGAVDEVLDAVISEHPSEWDRFVAGDEKVTQFFLGQVMRATKGRANGKAVAEALAARKAAANA
jgi:aspartyl-tRNA(Asn)/glutamyl-tRNA(Gln) amidotransferase subunit B